MLLVIEDLDKGDTSRVQDIFFKHSGILAELNTSMIFTISIFTLVSPQIADISGLFQMVSLPMIKVNTKEGRAFNPGRDIIKSIVKQRVDIETYFEENILDEMIIRSGGVLRDLFEMIDVAANSADFNDLQRINKQSAEYAFNRLKNKYLRMGDYCRSRED